jgi:hypothetical protein
MTPKRLIARIGELTTRRRPTQPDHASPPRPAHSPAACPQGGCASCDIWL